MTNKKRKEIIELLNDICGKGTQSARKLQRQIKNNEMKNSRKRKKK